MSDDHLLERVCASFRARLRFLQLQSGAARMVILAAVLLPLFLALDWWIHLASVYRLLGLVLYVAALAATLWYTLIKPLRRAWTNREVLSYLDTTAPKGEGMLLDLYELRSGERIQESVSDTGKSLIDDAIANLTPLAQRVRNSFAFHAINARRWLIAAVIACGLFAAAAATMSEHVAIGCKRFFNPFSQAYWPHRTDIQIAQPANGWSIPQMEDFTLEAKVTGVVPPQVVVSYRGEGVGYWIHDKVDVKNGAIAYEFKEVGAPLTFYLSGGDFSTNHQELSVVKRPSLKTILARYAFPEYAGIPNKEEHSGQLRGLEGTQVALDFTTSIPISRALFILDDAAPEEMTLTSDSSFSKNLMLTKDGAYVIQLFDKNGFREPQNKPERYQIQVKQDEPPVLELLDPPADISVTKNVLVHVHFKARDDFGLKKITVGYQIGDGPLTPISERITGVIKQSGLACDHEFEWDLHRVDELPEQGLITCSVTVEDVNPTGRGVDTKQFRIDVVKTSEFHRKAVAAAQDLLAEARNTYDRQWDAMEDVAKKLAGGGSGKLDDEVWTHMVASQEGASASARAMAQHLQKLTAAYETNHLEREFMANRLRQISQLVQKVVGSAESEMAMITDGLRQAKPGSSADEVAEKLKALRAKAVIAIHDHQKMAVLLLESILGKIHDWRDLQTATIEVTLLIEDQADMRDIVDKVAPHYIGKELGDLSDEQVIELEKIGARQRGLCDSETQLENGLATMIHAAKVQGRKNMIPYLEDPLTRLRQKKVQDSLDKAATKIANNQPFAIKDDLRVALEVLGEVRAGLVIAGDKVDPDQQLTLSAPLVAKRNFEDVKEEPKAQPEPGKEVEVDDAAGIVVDSSKAIEVLPAGKDKLSMLLGQAGESLRIVASRIEYLGKERGKGEMPRAMRLNHGRVAEMHARAAEGLKEAEEAAQEAPYQLAKERIAAYGEQVRQVGSLLGEKNIGAVTFQLENDIIQGLEGLIQYIAMQTKIDEAVKENKAGNGSDRSGRKFVLQAKDLEIAEAAVRDVAGAITTERDILRCASRMLKNPASTEGEKTIEKQNRAAAAAEQTRLATAMQATQKASAALSQPAAERLRKEGLAKLEELKLAAITSTLSDGKDQEACAQIDEALGALDGTFATLKEALEAREEAAAPIVAENTGPITKEVWDSQNGPQALAERLAADSKLPPAIKERMLAELKKDFPPAYKDFLIAYYSSCIEAESK
jgi:hypothetical protein